MKTALKCILVAGTLLAATPLVTAQPNEPITVALKYDSSAPAKTIYERARKAVRKACQVNGRLIPVRRALERTCVRPILEGFVTRTKNEELIALHADKIRKTISTN